MSGTIRPVRPQELPDLLELYTHLHEDSVPGPSDQLTALWERILADEHYHIIVAEREGALCASCTLVVIPNLTRGLRPYGVVENVVTHPDCRRQGLATACLDRARELAVAAGCYKLMLLTGAKGEGILGFYEGAGYDRREKTAFIQRLDRREDT